jgi:hypothetical protein
VFRPSTAAGPFHQGEILSDIAQVVVIPNSLASGDLQFEEITHPFGVILTQECDLDWDFKARMAGESNSAKLCPNVLFCELFPEEEIRPKIKGSELWKRIKQNQDERYHTLPQAPTAADLAQAGSPILIADFKQLFAIRTDELYARIAHSITRRTIIQMPWVQDLSNRAGYYLQRVAIPESEQTPAAVPIPLAPRARSRPAILSWIRRLFGSSD